MKKQTFFPKPGDMTPDNTIAISALGLGQPEGTSRRQGRNFERQQVCRGDNFLLNAFERYDSTELIGYTQQEDYIKINFWLSGKHTTILDGYGQHDHDRPEVFVTAGPRELIKVDLCSRDTRVSSLAICLLRDFFPVHMGLDPDQLPQPLRSILTPEEPSYAFHRFPLTPDLLAASRAILAAPFAVRREPLYIQAKAVELMCLLINHMESQGRRTAVDAEPRDRQESRLCDARAFVARHYAEGITLERISREVGLNKMALTSGFRQLFGMTVYDCLQKERMERAYELLQDGTRTIAQIAEAVGYRHPCNFSTAFHAYFGCTPQHARGNRL